MDKSGLLLCAKYAVSPNFFGYCGPNKNLNIVDHLKENIADKELVNILTDFETLFPYLELIARKNKISDPFDRQVVEAYWLGNNLLKNITGKDCWYLFEEKLLISKKIDKKNLFKIKEKISTHQFFPHHTFHVFNIFKKMSSEMSTQTLETMDECRVNYGKIKNYDLISKKLLIETKSLKIENNLLTLDTTIFRKIVVDYRGKQFLKDLKSGDWVSFHWGRACDVLTQNQVNNLQYYTKRAIEYYNS